MITFDVSRITASEQKALELGMAQINRTKVPPLANVEEYLDYKVHQDIIANLLVQVDNAEIDVIRDKYQSADEAKRAEIMTKVKEVVPDAIKVEESIVEEIINP